MANKMFKNLTLQQKFQLFFTEKEFTQVQSKTGKYKVYVNKYKQIFYFLGKSGGVRFNIKNSVSGSISVSDKIKKSLTAWNKLQNQTEKIDLEGI